ncbi:MAG: dimethylsulfonioproprionate lyase family protein [Sedimentitalea sp.]|uniref:dimethylsulfonioproprionate lyase family protein n=1 Tax=Sedimentitalea sp. TaxID=2048915 RepID=UPI00326470FF
MASSTFNHLLEEARKVHAAHPALRDFCPFPGDLQPQPLTPHRIGGADLMAHDPGTSDADLMPLRDAFLAGADDATWRETYRDTNIGDDFLSRFGCYCLIGEGGGWSSAQMASYVVYMPPGLYYPWHHHPAEELYLVLSGQAQFHRAGEGSEALVSGDSSFHGSNQSHAMQTFDHPVMAYVLWRSNLDVPPVLTQPEAFAVIN